MFIDDPNLLIINEENINPEELVEYYTDTILDIHDRNEIQEILWCFLLDAQYMFLRQYYIDQAKANLGYLEFLETMYKELIDDEDDC